MYMPHCGIYMVCLKNFGEWYQKTNKTEDTNKLTLLVYFISTQNVTIQLAVPLLISFRILLRIVRL
jgi:hypothetical protein